MRAKLSFVLLFLICHQSGTSAGFGDNVSDSSGVENYKRSSDENETDEVYKKFGISKGIFYGFIVGAVFVMVVCFIAIQMFFLTCVCCECCEVHIQQRRSWQWWHYAATTSTGCPRGMDVRRPAVNPEDPDCAGSSCLRTSCCCLCCCCWNNVTTTTPTAKLMMAMHQQARRCPRSRKCSDSGIRLGPTSLLEPGTPLVTLTTKEHFDKI